MNRKREILPKNQSNIGICQQISEIIGRNSLIISQMSRNLRITGRNSLIIDKCSRFLGEDTPLFHTPLLFEKKSISSRTHFTFTVSATSFVIASPPRLFHFATKTSKSLSGESPTMIFKNVSLSRFCSSVHLLFISWVFP